jgi:hypothetical protein
LVLAALVALEELVKAHKILVLAEVEPEVILEQVELAEVTKVSQQRGLAAAVVARVSLEFIAMIRVFFGHGATAAGEAVVSVC